MFDNPEIPLDELPAADDVAWQPMEPGLRRRLLAQSGIAILSVAIGLATLHLIFRLAFASRGMPFNFAWLWLLTVVITIVLLVWPGISVPKIGYAVRERDILFKSGVFWHTVTVVPFNRVQHVEKSSTLLDRRFGVSTLKLYTAGGSGGDLSIPGLSATTAEKLRAFIIGKVGSSIERR